MNTQPRLRTTTVLLVVAMLAVCSWWLFRAANDWAIRPPYPAAFVLRPSSLTWVIGALFFAVPAAIALCMRWSDARFVRVASVRVTEFLLVMIAIPSLFLTVLALPSRAIFFDDAMLPVGYGVIMAHGPAYDEIQSITAAENSKHLCVNLHFSEAHGHHDPDWNSCGFMEPDQTTTRELLQFLEKKTGLCAETRQ